MMKVRHKINTWLIITGMSLAIANVTHASIIPPTTGLVAWYRSDLGVSTDVNGVTTWADQSGNSNNATDTGGAAEPTISTQTIGLRTNQPVLSFNGSGSQFMSFSLPNANLYSGMSIIFVGKTTSTSPYQTVVSSGVGATAGVRWAFGLGSDSTFSQGLGWGASNGSLGLGSGGILNTTSFFMNAYLIDKTAAAWDVRVSQDDPATGFTDDLTGPGTIADTSFPTGAFNGWLGKEAGYQLTGYIGEVLIYNHSLSAPEFNALQTYFNAYYFAVPEPASLGLLACGSLLLLRRRKA